MIGSVDHVYYWTRDMERAVEFYRDKVGFHLDHDTRNEHMHVVQLTPRGSGCSIVIGDLPSQHVREGEWQGIALEAENIASEALVEGTA